MFGGYTEFRYQNDAVFLADKHVDMAGGFINSVRG